MTADEPVAGVPRLCARQADCTRPRGHDDECGPDRDQARVARYAAALSSARLDAVLAVADTELAEARAEVDVSSWDEHLLAFSQWIDEGTTLGPEAQVWHRVSKVAEEAGEAVAALLGYTGANPRKGYTHTLDQVDAELMQTALSALGASAHLHAGDPTYSPFRRLRLQLARDMHRVGVDVAEPADQPHPTPEAGEADCPACRLLGGCVPHTIGGGRFA